MASEAPLRTCGECHKPTPDREYVNNWGTCDECFENHYNEYMLLLAQPEDGPNVPSEPVQLELPGIIHPTCVECQELAPDCTCLEAANVH